MRPIGIIGLSILVGTVSPSAWAQSQQQLFQREVNAVHPIPINPPANLSHTDLAWYAWRLFAAVNQGTGATVQDGSTREKPAAAFLSTGAGPGPLPNPTIFEALYHRTEAYPAYAEHGRPASPLGKAPVYRFTPIESKPFTVRGAQANYVNLDETNQIGQNFIFYRQSKNPNFPILFMAKVNRQAVTYAQTPGRIQPEKGHSWVFPDNTLEIKAAWRRVEDIKNSRPNNYHLATATWYEGTEGSVPKVKTGIFALVGLHIIQKSANYPHFIFTTFEHVNAVTRDGKGVIVDPRYELTYSTLAYGPNNSKVANFQGAYANNVPGLPAANNVITKNFRLPPAGPAPNAANPPGCIENAPYTDPKGKSMPGKYKCAHQGRTISREVNDVNNAVAPLLRGTVWENYRLKGVQGTPTGDQTTLDYYLANIVVETSQPGVQLFHGGVSGTGTSTFTNKRLQKNLTTEPLTYNEPVPAPTVIMGGCMGCHGVAQTMIGTDFSFLPPGSLYQGKSVDAVPPADVPAAALAAHKRAMAEKKAYMFIGAGQ